MSTYTKSFSSSLLLPWNTVLSSDMDSVVVSASRFFTPPDPKIGPELMNSPSMSESPSRSAHSLS
ncbi:MAG: hypothetical protein ACYTCU_01280 [Planctomycetota bacterium]